MSIKLIRGKYSGFENAVKSLLPETGSVEVQIDTPGREHPTHTHPTNETLLILEGSITFFSNKMEIECKPGDRILLEKETPHSSKAGTEGCLYVISLEYIEN